MSSRSTTPRARYRAEALALNPLHYWTLDEGPSTLAIDIGSGGENLAYRNSGIDWRAHVQDAAGVPYGAAPEWSQSSGAGLSGRIDAVGVAFVIAGFVRLAAGASGDRTVWRAGSNARRLLLSSAGGLTLEFDGAIVAAGPLAADTWHHVAIRRTTAARVELWIDGVKA